jgi:hypothetical protein
MSLAGLAGGMAATVALTPELREAGGTDVIFEAPDLGLVGRGVLLAVAGIAIGVIVSTFASAARTGGPPSRSAEVTAVSVGIGALAGLGYRVVTATTAGANIGGGLVLLAAPFAALLFVGYVAARLLRMRRDDSPQRDHA